METWDGTQQPHGIEETMLEELGGQPKLSGLSTNTQGRAESTPCHAAGIQDLWRWGVSSQS